MLCGVDEAGRGPLAGPVFAAAVILDPNKIIDGLMDSKRLNNHKLCQLHSIIFRDAVEVSFASASVIEIDNLNILQASLLAMQRAIKKLKCMPSKLIIDGLHCPEIKGVDVNAIVRGDSIHQEISAASIIAKVERDKFMIQLDKEFPEYNFKQHKGYPTKEHIANIKEHGVSIVHRKTFKPVSTLI